MKFPLLPYGLTQRQIHVWGDGLTRKYQGPGKTIRGSDRLTFQGKTKKIKVHATADSPQEFRKGRPGFRLASGLISKYREKTDCQSLFESNIADQIPALDRMLSHFYRDPPTCSYGTLTRSFPSIGNLLDANLHWGVETGKKPYRSNDIQTLGTRQDVGTQEISFEGSCPYYIPLKQVLFTTSDGNGAAPIGRTHSRHIPINKVDAFHRKHYSGENILLGPENLDQRAEEFPLQSQQTNLETHDKPRKMPKDPALAFARFKSHDDDGAVSPVLPKVEMVCWIFDGRTGYTKVILCGTFSLVQLVVLPGVFSALKALEKSGYFKNANRAIDEQGHYKN